MWIIIRLLIGIAILVLVEFYFINRLNFAVKNSFPDFYEKKFAIIKKIFLVWVNLFPLALIFIYTYFAITGSYLTEPDNWLINYLLIYPFWVSFILMIQCAIIFILIDLIKLLVLPFLKKYKKSIVRFQSVLIFLITIFFLFYIPGRIIYDYNSVSVREIVYEKKQLAEPLKNFRIAFISDLQADYYTDSNRLDKYINVVNNLKPDITLIGGDLITTGPDYIKLSGTEAGKLKAKYGVYSCVGDHDNWAYRNDYAKSRAEVEASLKANNVEMVDNGIRKINVNGAEIEITFITNTYVQTVPENILDSLTSIDKSDFKIFLTHQPQERLIETAKNNNYNLYLAGHTHGGQITLLFPFINLTPTMFETKYIRGDFHFGNMLMVITRGLGMSLAPVRYNSTPEVTLIKLINSK